MYSILESTGGRGQRNSLHFGGRTFKHNQSTIIIITIERLLSTMRAIPSSTQLPAPIHHHQYPPRRLSTQYKEIVNFTISPQCLPPALRHACQSATRRSAPTIHHDRTALHQYHQYGYHPPDARLCVFMTVLDESGIEPLTKGLNARWLDWNLAI